MGSLFYIKVKFDARLQEVSTNINLNQKQNVKNRKIDRKRVAGRE